MNTNPAATTSSSGSKDEVVAQMRHVTRFLDNHDNGPLIRAIGDVSFELRTGEVVGLLGPSRSGKSTTMRILAGRLATSEGKIRVFARSPRWRAIRARISYLPQKPTDARSDFVAEVMSFFRDLVAGVKRKRPTAEEVSGQPDPSRRLAVVTRIMLQKTRLVLLDEPFVGLAAADREEMTRLIRTMAEQGRTVFVCSTSLFDIAHLCSRLICLYRGEIQAIGNLHQLLERRESLRFVADLLPDEMAERLLEIIRHGIGISAPGSSSSPGVQEMLAQVKKTEESPCDAPLVAPASDTILALLLKAGTRTDPQVVDPTLTVNHEMLTALTRPTDGASPSPSEQPKLPRVTDP
jgi:ABC-type multidrug transport system ATPase subunit